MAKNGPKGAARKGAVRKRSQAKGANGNWVKRNKSDGRFMDQKRGGEPFKGVTKER